MLTYDEMVEKTREFYDELQIDISDKYVDLAVRSLTMPQYARLFEISCLKSRSVWFENGTEKARKLKKENSKRLIKSAILGNADIFVVRKSYNRQKAQDIAHLVLFLLLYLVFLSLDKIFEFNSCI